MRFSDRIGATSHEPIVHLDSMPNALRNTLWNAINMLYDEVELWPQIGRFCAFHFFKVPTDLVPSYAPRAAGWLREKFFKLEWFDVYNFIEFIATNHWVAATVEREPRPLRPAHTNDQVIAVLNVLLARECSGFRFVGRLLAPISDPVEIESVEHSIAGAATRKLEGVREHLLTAVSLLGKRPNPDYRNSIKESISAVESAAKELSSTDSKGLSGALTELGKIIPIHGAQKQAFEALYGWTIDADGIRHSILDASTVDDADARYMLVICSAFINYLLVRSQAKSK